MIDPARRPTVPGVAFLQLDGTSVELREVAGTGTPILLLHEALGSLSLWGRFPERLAGASGRRVIAWSRQGFGRSGPLPEPPGPDFLDRAADQTLALLSRLEIDQVHLHGHSDGTAIALLVAARSPERVRSLVLEAPHVSVETGALEAIERMRSRFEAGELRARLARHHDDPDAVFRNWADTWLDPRFRDWSIEDRLCRVRAPTLLIHGRDDAYFTTDQLARITAAIPTAEVLVLPDCGHSPFREQPEIVAAAAARQILAAEMTIDPPSRSASFVP